MREYWENEAKILAMLQWSTQERVTNDHVPDEYYNVFMGVYCEEVDKLYSMESQLLEAL